MARRSPRLARSAAARALSLTRLWCPSRAVLPERPTSLPSQALCGAAANEKHTSVQPSEVFTRESQR